MIRTVRVTSTALRHSREFCRLPRYAIGRWLAVKLACRWGGAVGGAQSPGPSSRIGHPDQAMRRSLIVADDPVRRRALTRMRRWVVMGRLMKRVEEAAKSPKAKSLEKKMIRQAKNPQTRAKISKRFRKLTKKGS
jgi:hypothetical protein